jgi:hypothetical protein
MCMSIHTRWGDRATFIILCVLVFLFFISSVTIFYYEMTLTNSFWVESAKCVAAQDFNCLLDVRSEQTITKDLSLSIIGAALSVQGLFVGMTVMMLYKGFRRTEIKKSGVENGGSNKE